MATVEPWEMSVSGDTRSSSSPPNNGPGWVLRRGGRLEDPDLTLSDQGEVSECAPDVHAQNGLAHLAANLYHANRIRQGLVRPATRARHPEA